MLTLVVPGNEMFNEDTNEFITLENTTLQLEHSLVSLSMWESKWKKSFLDRKLLSFDEWVDYVRCMNLTENIDPNVYLGISANLMIVVQQYIDDSMTAATFSDKNKVVSDGTYMTSEIIYYWMVTLGIPFSCEKWHLNRLLALIKTCNAKNSKEEKMSRKEVLRSYDELNRARRKASGSRG